VTDDEFSSKHTYPHNNVSFTTFTNNLPIDASVNNIIWAEIESCCSIIAACLPTYGPLVRSLALPTFISSTLRSLLNSVRRGRSTDRSESNKNVWFPILGQRRNFASAKTHAGSGSGSEEDVVEKGEIRVQRSFETDVQRQRSGGSMV
jgi:hypothetical protein